MNQTQKKYAIERIDKIAIRKAEAIKHRYTVPKIALTMKEKYKLVQSGKVKLKRNYDPLSIGRYTYWHDLFDFSKYEKPEKQDKCTMEKELKSFGNYCCI